MVKKVRLARSCGLRFLPGVLCEGWRTGSYEDGPTVRILMLLGHPEMCDQAAGFLPGLQRQDSVACACHRLELMPVFLFSTNKAPGEP